MTDTASAAPTYEHVIAAWNAQADEHNQWDALGEDEKIEWAVACAKAAPPTVVPIGWYVTGCSRILDEHDAKAEARHIGGSAKALPLYTAPAVVEPLTDEQIQEAILPINPHGMGYFLRIARAIEHAHGIGIKDGDSHGLPT